MSTRHCDVLIIGGGIVGAACCYELSRGGARVTLIDRGEIGHGCSYGNAGWITPCFALPLPMPGMLPKATKWLLDPASPLYIQPQADIQWVRWMWRFLRSMTQSKMLRSVAALTQLSRISQSIYRQLDEQSPGAFSYTASGLLMVAQTDEGMRAAERDMNLVAGHGIHGVSLGVSEVFSLEPAIAGATIIGGVHFPDEAHIEPLAAVRHLIELAIGQGATVLPNVEVLDLHRRHRAIQSITTSHGDFTADKLIVATGAWSGRMAAKIGVDLPMLSGKGYAVILPPPPVMPRQPMMLVDRKLAITPRAGSLRLAGTLELVGLDESVTMSRVRAIIRGAQTVLPIGGEPAVREIWRGLRPCTPDGVPAIGAAPGLDNVYIAAGHQMLGLQTATGTAAFLAALIVGTTPPVDPEPFRVDRFSRAEDAR